MKRFADYFPGVPSAIGRAARLLFRLRAQRVSNPDDHPLAPVFDAAYYRKQLQALRPASSATNPLEHYLTTGWRQGLDPHPLFSVRWYLDQNPDVSAAGVEPLGHYLTSGWRENRRPHPQFNDIPYLSRHPELLLANICPLLLLPQHPGLASGPLQPARHWPSYYPRSRPYPYLAPEVMAAKINAYRATKGRSNKTVFCTCIIGGYDTLRLPEHLSPEIDYILFTDQPTDGYGVFDVRLLQSQETDRARTSRKVKLQPHLYLADYDLIVWCDANIIIRMDILPFLAAFTASGAPLAFLPNQVYNCIYQQAVDCVHTQRDRPETVVHQMLALQREGYPADNGLIEANFFACRPQHPATPLFFDAWREQLHRGSRRDQLSANYVLWKQGLSYFPLLGDRQSTCTHPGTALLVHGTYDADHFAQAAAIALQSSAP